MSMLRCICLLVLTVGVSSLVMSQVGSIKGAVSDENGEAVPFANVVIEGTRMGASADYKGEYTITNVAPAQYELQASAVGYRKKKASVTVPTGGAVTQNFVLAQDLLNLEGVVITGSFTPKSKLESTVSISTLTPRELLLANPRSTTEVLRYTPGFTRVESSGGEVNQNISVRGILGVEYVMFMEDGLPVFPTMHTFFMNADNLFRTDENIASVEVVRGGSSALFGSSTPGAIVNFINKTGGPELGGALKATTGTEGFARYDLNVNGPLGEEWRFNLGGFYRYDRGVRDPGFTGIRGGQFKGSVTRLLDNGYVRVSMKVIDDRNQFILPLPFRNADNPEYVPGFSDYGAMNTNEANHLRVPTPDGVLELPLDDGLRTKATWLTADASFEFEGGWTVQNTGQIMQNDQGWNGIFTGQPLRDGSWFQSLGFPAGSTYQLFYTNHFDSTGRNKLPFDRGSNAGLGLVSASQLVHVEKPISAFQDQVQIRKRFDEHTVSLGIYFANYTQTNRWYFTDILMDVRDNPRLLDLVVFVPAPPDTIPFTQNGFRRLVSLYRNGSGSTTIFSGVIGGDFKLTENLRAEVGFRYEHNNFVQTAENQSNVDLDGDPTTPYDNEQWGNGTFRQLSKDMNDWAASLGLNYSLTDQVSIYAQGSRAYKMPALDEFFDAAAQDKVDLFEARETIMIEGGVKFASREVAFTVNGFWGQLKNIVGQGAEIDPATQEITWVLRPSPENRSYGAEIEVSASPVSGLNLIGAATLLKTESVEAAGAALTAGGVPPALFNLSAAYTVSGFTALADWHFVGTRDLINASYNDTTGKYRFYDKVGELKAYNYFNVGASYTFPGQALTLSANLLNVSQSIGLEEGDPRRPGSGGAEFFNARPLLPRRLMVSLSYQF